MSKRLICICCPLGCEMTVESSGEEIKVSGNRCAKGEQYARDELLDPRRVVTAVVRTRNAELPCLPVKTEKPVRKVLIAKVLSSIYQITVNGDIECGQVLHEDIDGEGTRLLATRKFDCSNKI